jgi:hypothetical protein
MVKKFLIGESAQHRQLIEKLVKSKMCCKFAFRASPLLFS